MESAVQAGNQPQTSDWLEMDAEHNIHPYCDGLDIIKSGITVIAKGEGSYVWDSDGNKILDGMAGLWCVNVGYGRTELAEAASRQMSELPYYNMFFQSSTPPQISLADKLSEITPDGLDNFFFANSGSEANDSIVRLVRHFWIKQGQPEKSHFIARNKGYHGSTLASVSLGGLAAMHDMERELLPGFHHIPEPHYWARNDGKTEAEFAQACANELEAKILELGAKNVAAFVAEPVQGAGGVIPPPEGYWPAVERVCRKHDVLLVADEVICGFGRLGEWFGSQHYGITPDIMPMAKGLSSGYLPISAVAFNARIAEGLRSSGALVHGFTYSGHPVCCAVAHANIAILEEEGLIERTREETGPYFRELLQQVTGTHPLVGELRAEGLVAGIQLMQDRDAKIHFPPGHEAAVFCRKHALANGLIMRAVESTMVLCPPLVISRSELDELAEKVSASLDATARHFGIA